MGSMHCTEHAGNRMYKSYFSFHKPFPSQIRLRCNPMETLLADPRHSLRIFAQKSSVYDHGRCRLSPRHWTELVTLDPENGG